VDCERSGAVKAGVVACGFGEWHGVAGCEDSVAGGGGVGSGRKRRGVGEQDDGRGGDDDGGDADNDYDDDYRPRNRCALYIYDVYI
jgi:hypothetical protein